MIPSPWKAWIRLLLLLMLSYTPYYAVDGHSWHSLPYRGNNGNFTCYDCTGPHCARLMSHRLAGRCHSARSKCFIRRDPNGVIYRGCADRIKWPHYLNLEYNGCRYQTYGEWDKQQVLWCFCDKPLCNVKIQHVTQYFGGRMNVGSKVIPVATVNLYNHPRPRTQQKRVMFYQPLGYANDQYSEPLDRSRPRAPPQPQPQPQPRPRPQPQPQPQPPANRWFDDRQDNDNGVPWTPPHQNINSPVPRIPPKPRPTPVLFTTPAPATPAPTVSDDLNPYDQLPRDLFTKGPRGEVEGKSAKTGENDAAPPFDLSKYPWPWNKYFPRTGDDKEPKPIQIDDLGPPGGNANEVTDRHTCERMRCEHACKIENGHPYCTCPTGFELSGNKRTCKDIDECRIRNGACSHDCQNRIGSYICMCPSGYRLDTDLKTCQDYNECRYEEKLNCEQGCRNLPGTYECVCNQPGYVLNSDGKSCDDIDECEEGTHMCDHMCMNTVGSYSCDCHHGYHLLGNKRTCSDTNECLTDQGGCQQRCRNTAGSFECFCNRGFDLNVDGRTCDDVDECLVQNGGCQHDCFNTEGSYECGCYTGFQLDSNAHSCIDVNECLVNNGGCDHGCENVEGSFSCFCQSGYTLNVDARTCDPIDKCSQDNGGCEHVCTNTAAGARCSCRPGFMLRPDGRTCADINECQSQNGGCDHNCVNTVGSYECRCRTGYTLNVDKATCDDINECETNLGGCAQNCENLPGSYRCACNNGYELAPDQKQCRDINECDNNNGGCEQICINEPGSFRCSCEGIIYKLHTDGRSCVGTCPTDFVKSTELNSCYKVFTPTSDIVNRQARTVPEAQDHCRSLHPLGGLVSVQSTAEKNFLSALLKREPQMMEGWQGWWTSGVYHTGLNQFQWSDGNNIDNNSPHWGFRKLPYADTCVWVLQISVYNQTWGNYDCLTKTGHICEIELPK